MPARDEGPPGQRDEGYDDYGVLSGREEIRTWAENNGIVPARREGTGGTGRTELVHRSDLRRDHEEQDWNTFHREFEDRNLVVVHASGGSHGRFRLVDRDDLGERGALDDEAAAELLEGDADTTEVTERLMGRDVELPDGEKIGIVSDVDRGEDHIPLDEDPSLADEIKVSINWSDEGDGPVLPSDRILKLDREAVVVERNETS